MSVTVELITTARVQAINAPPSMEEAPDCANSRGPKAHQSHTDSDSDSAAVKQLATYTATLALLGYSLHELSDCTFLVCRWDRSRHLEDLRAVAAFVRQAGGQHA